MTVGRPAADAAGGRATATAFPPLARWHAVDVRETLALLSSSETGLSDAEARRRLAIVGPNRIPRSPPVTAWRVLARQLRSVVVGLLAIAALVALLMGEPIEAGAIGAVLLINTGLGFFVELKATRTMEALLRYQAVAASVVRGGRTQEIDAADLVPGDLVVLQAGDSVPADARLVEAVELRTGEAALTGESMPVGKDAEAAPEEAPLPDRRSMVYAGTTVASGSGRAIVVDTGAGTELGRIGGLLGEIEAGRTPLEERLDALGRKLVWVTLGVAGVVTALGWARGLSLPLMLETGVALAIAAVPEGLPAVATIALAVGMGRMARRNALVRRLHAVEALGSTTVIGADKTGTLTAGEMTVTELLLDDREIAVSGEGFTPVGEFREGGTAVDPATDPVLRRALTIARRTARVQIGRDAAGWSVRGDPTDAALAVLAEKAGLQDASAPSDEPSAELPFDTARRYSASFHDGNGELRAFVKGAPADVLERCARVGVGGGTRLLDGAERDRILAANADLARRGMRVIALADGPVEGATDAAVRDLEFVALAGITDPPAEGVAETVRMLSEAGIRTVMITGDQAATAAAVATQLGLPTSAAAVVEGAALEGMSEEEFRRRGSGVSVFSRVSPKHKLDIVRALQADGEIVAMLGDGVNDAAALKQADVGVAMGLRGTDVAREVSAIVLQDDRFPTVGAAVEEGRVIFDNIRKFIYYLFSCNLAEVWVIFAAGIAGLPLPLLPLQILWLNLVTDTFPALALALEPGEPGIMRRPPRAPEAPILTGRFIRSISFFGVLITVSTLAAFLWGLRSGGQGYEHAVTLSFMTLALAQLLHLGNARSTGDVLAPSRAASNPYALGAVILVVLLQVAAVTVEPLARLLQLRPLAPADWALVVALAAVPAVVGQLIRRSRSGRRPAASGAA
ncbi:MAG: HAD-IC family P-type ATPase [Gemmatimonadota bacterium]